MKQRSCFTFLITASLTAAFPAAAMAADSGQAIRDVTLEIVSEIEIGDDSPNISVASLSSGFDISQAEVTNTPDDEWEEGDKPKLKIVLEADDGYYFSGVSKEDIHLRGDDGTVTSVSRSGDAITVRITMDALEDEDAEYNLNVYQLSWSQTGAVALWEENPSARKYEVRLYRGSTPVTSAAVTYETSYDFSSYITRGGVYTFQVRAVRSASSMGTWEESASREITTEEAGNLAAAAGSWVLDEAGWWYRNADGTYPAGVWQQIDGIWYCFDAKGYMMADTVTPDGYTVGSDGGWIESPDAS